MKGICLILTPLEVILPGGMARQRRGLLTWLTFLVVGCILFLQIGCQQETCAVAESKPILRVPKAATGPPKAQTKSQTKVGPRIKFDKLTHDFGKIGPGTSNTCEFKFTNTGNALLKITKVQACCGFRARLKGKKKEYAPGESGTVTVTFNASKSSRTLTKYQYVYSSDKTRPKTKLTVKARIVPKVAYEPEKLKLLLKGENTGCPPITLRSLDGRPFSIKQFKSTGNCITAEYDSAVKAPKFVLKPEVNIEKLKKNLNGRINIGLTHPECNMVTIFFETLPRFTVKPVSIIVFNAEPQKLIKREVWILNNYGEDFEVESASSKKGIVKVLSQEKVGKRYKFELEITPPTAKGKRIFTDVFFVNIKGGEQLKANCNGFYARKSKDSSSR